MLGRHSAGLPVHDVLAIPTRRWSQEKEKALVPSGRCMTSFLLCPLKVCTVAETEPCAYHHIPSPLPSGALNQWISERIWSGGDGNNVSEQD